MGFFNTRSERVWFASENPMTSSVWGLYLSQRVPMPLAARRFSCRWPQIAVTVVCGIFIKGFGMQCILFFLFKYHFPSHCSNKKKYFLFTKYIFNYMELSTFVMYVNESLLIIAWFLPQCVVRTSVPDHTTGRTIVVHGIFIKCF